MKAVGRSALAILGAAIEQAFRAIPRALGRRLDTGDAWLWGPIGTEGAVGTGYYAALASQRGLVLDANNPEAGLLPDFAALRGPAFDPNQVDPRIRDFYEHTARYRLVVSARWSPLFLPFGWILVGAVSRRISQLNFPLVTHESSAEMTSQVLLLREPADGKIAFTGWLRTDPTTGLPVYVGLYEIAHPPREAGPCVRVMFPLPHGSSTVLLRPSMHADGSFRLSSDGRGFGYAGYYRIHESSGDVRRARYVLALKEHFRLWVGPDGLVRADHLVNFFRIPILRLRYTLHHSA